MNPEPWDGHERPGEDGDGVDGAQRHAVSLLVQQPGDNGDGKSGKGDDDLPKRSVGMPLVTLVLELEALAS